MTESLNTPPTNITPLWHGHDVALCTRGAVPPPSTQNWAATGVSIDSRTVTKGDLFIALKGPAHDGHDHVAAALRAGAMAALVSHIPANLPPNAQLVIVQDTFIGLQDLGRRARARAQGKIIAVTGSVGKTGSKEQLRTMLTACGNVAASQGSFNNHWGVPLSLALLPETAHFGVFELGMNHAGELQDLSRQVQPHVALITNVEAVHLEFFASVAAIADAKAEIFMGMNAASTAVLNRDNPHYARLVGHARTQGIQNILSFGSTVGVDAQLLDYTAEAESGFIQAQIFGKPLRFRIGAAGLHYAFNALGTLLAAHAAGADMATCAAALAAYHPPSGRGARQTIPLPQGGMITLIDESYNASPVATRAAIQTLGQTTPSKNGRRIAVLGDMRELGATAPQLHADLATPLSEAKIDQLYCCGHIIEGLFATVPSAMRGAYASDSKTLAPKVAAALRDGDVVLVKGSKSVHMELIITALQHATAA
jgi:UDP-N-acetylmuramoyl-tripeptide--D-alanyl-D-alanine ligase